MRIWTWPPPRNKATAAYAREEIWTATTSRADHRAAAGGRAPPGTRAGTAGDLLRINDTVKIVADDRLDFFDVPANFARVMKGYGMMSRSRHERHDCPCCGSGVGQLAGRIAKGEVTAEAVMQAHLHRIAACQPILNAFIRIEQRRGVGEGPRAADKVRAKGGKLGPLHGVPMAHKDMLWRKGRVMTGASPILKTWRAKEDSTLISRLEAAGALTIGTLNMSEFASSPTGRNPHFGDCRNAHDPERVAGGSSSGSAAAVAARMLPCALGSDTGGSIRIPAALNGVVGLKPTQGRVSNHGSIPRAWSLDCIGPIARHASRLRADPVGDRRRRPERSLLPRLSPAVRATPQARSGARRRSRSPAPSRLGAIDEPVMAAVDAAIAALKATGLRTRKVKLPELGALHAFGDVISKSGIRVAASGLDARTPPRLYPSDV